jgi:hypothetical protein
MHISYSKGEATPSERLHPKLVLSSRTTVSVAAGLIVMSMPYSSIFNIPMAKLRIIIETSKKKSRFLSFPSSFFHQPSAFFPLPSYLFHLTSSFFHQPRSGRPKGIISFGKRHNQAVGSIISCH